MGREIEITLIAMKILGNVRLSIAMFSDKVKVTSEIIANSTVTNPVIIRNIFGSLKKA